jgi:hypothetical protein
VAEQRAGRSSILGGTELADPEHARAESIADARALLSTAIIEG